MSKRDKTPAPVLAVEFEDKGQDYGTWYVRNGLVIDCEPCSVRPYLGTKVTRPPEEGQPVHVLLPKHGGYTTTEALTVKVTLLSAAEARDVVERWRQLMAEIINE